MRMLFSGSELMYWEWVSIHGNVQLTCMITIAVALRNALVNINSMAYCSGEWISSMYSATSLININTNQSPRTSSSGRWLLRVSNMSEEQLCMRCKGRVWVYHLRTQRNARPITLFIHRAVRHVHPLQTAWDIDENRRRLHSADCQLLSTSRRLCSGLLECIRRHIKISRSDLYLTHLWTVRQDRSSHLDITAHCSYLKKNCSRIGQVET